MRRKSQRKTEADARGFGDGYRDARADRDLGFRSSYAAAASEQDDPYSKGYARGYGAGQRVGFVRTHLLGEEALANLRAEWNEFLRERGRRPEDWL